LREKKKEKRKKKKKKIVQQFATSWRYREGLLDVHRHAIFALLGSPFLLKHFINYFWCLFALFALFVCFVAFVVCVVHSLW
jgi:hypothetical protein